MEAGKTVKKALVTGGSRGIGAAIVRALARDGWHVYIHYHRSAGAAQALAEETGGEAVGGDVALPLDVKTIFQRTGPVDLLVNNAGVAHYGLLQDMTEMEWRRLFAVNTDGAFRCCREAIPAMVRRRSGCIINTASVWGQCGASCEAAYSASKGALIAFTKALAKELGPSGVRVNCVCPGVIDTDMIANLTGEDKKALAADTPLGRIGTPEDVAELVSFLASDRAAFITGQVIAVDGGFAL